MKHESTSGGDAIKQRAAQYVRMSTDEQDYSPFNQEKAIAAYALAHNLMVVRKYADEGRSGLNHDRPGFKEMLHDVQAGQTHFSVILVYDVSRWGRFQDVDEGAYYEQICKKAGVRVIFCAEDFKDDGSLASTLLKAMDRVEAAKYSLRLSIRVFAGQCNLGSRGFWQGAPAGYGLRRALLDASGSPRMILGDGQRKFIQSDRVVLRPGPPDEVEIVRRIFRSFAFDGKGEVVIAKELNDEGRVNQYGRPWNRSTISHILASEKYVGHNVYNRTSHKLKSGCVKNPPEMWIRATDAFEAVVLPEMFHAAQQRMDEITNRKSNQRMLDNLRSLLAAEGRLTSKIIDHADSLPCTGSYHKRFGSLLNAYELIGYKPANTSAKNEAARQVGRDKRRRVLCSIFADFRRLGLTVRFDWNRRAYIINDKITLAVYMLRRLEGDRGDMKWTLRQRRKSNTKLIIGVRVDATSDSVRDYLLLHTAGLSHRLKDSDIDVETLGAASFERVTDLTGALCEATLAA